MRDWVLIGLRLLVGLDLQALLGLNLVLNKVVEMISCTSESKPLALPWGRTPRLDSGVRVRKHVVRIPTGRYVVPTGRVIATVSIKVPTGSRALQGLKINYTPIEKLILALHLEDDLSDTPIEDKKELSDPWILFTDRLSCIDGSGAVLILTNPKGAEFTYALRFRFDATNNEAEYEALIAGLRIAEQMGVKNLQANVDSRLMANQVNGSYIAKEPGMIKYLEKVKALTSTFK
ncbi:reverse transcriptase domain-containing protein [Tanacetum coccineum]